MSHTKLLKVCVSADSACFFLSALHNHHFPKEEFSRRVKMFVNMLPHESILASRYL